MVFHVRNNARFPTTTVKLRQLTQDEFAFHANSKTLFKATGRTMFPLVTFDYTTTTTTASFDLRDEV